MRFEGRNVIVTGGSRGIGLACVQRFVELGAAVLNVDLVPFDDETARRFAAEDTKVAWREADLGDAGVVHQIVPWCSAIWGPPDVLVNNVAYVGHRGGDVGSTSEEEWNRQFAISLTGAFLLTKDALEAMAERGSGVIVNVASIGGLLPFGDAVAYSAAKAALLQMSRSVAIDYGRRGVRCNAVAPGPIDTSTFSSIKDDPLELRDRESRTALGRIGRPDEVAKAVTFLASDDASFITGATLTVDGGWSASQWNPRLGPRTLND